MLRGFVTWRAMPCARRFGQASLVRGFGALLSLSGISMFFKWGLSCNGTGCSGSGCSGS